MRRGKKKRHFKQAVDSDEEEERQLEATGMRQQESSSQSQKQHAKSEQRDRARQVARHDQQDAITAQCWWWIESARSFDRTRLLALGNKVSLVFAPPHKALSQQHFHLYLVPIPHAPSLTACDEDTWSEIYRFQASLRQMAAAQSKSVLFYETVLPSSTKSSFWQTRLEVVFVPHEVAADAPLYFKTALTEQAEEWGTHQKLIKTGRRAAKNNNQKELRATVPANFAYFYVEFGGDSGDGYVQLIESRSFPQDFGADTVLGMMRMDPLRFRSSSQAATKRGASAARSADDEERQRIRQFLDLWKPFDWTTELDS